MADGFIVESYPEYCEWHISETVINQACALSKTLISPPFVCLRKRLWKFEFLFSKDLDYLKIKLVKLEDEGKMRFNLWGSFIFINNSKTPMNLSEKCAKIIVRLAHDRTYTFMKMSAFIENLNQYLTKGQISIKFLINAKPLNSNEKTAEILQGYPELNSTTLCNKPDFSDVELIVGDNKFYAHKAILANCSPVFAAMFKTNMKESTENIVRIKDMSAEVVDGLLNWIYTNEVKFHHDTIYNLSMASEKYQITGLKKLCEKYLYKSLTVTNWIETIFTADKCNMENLKKLTLVFIGHSKNVLTPESFNELKNLDKMLILEIFECFATKFYPENQYALISKILLATNVTA